MERPSSQLKRSGMFQRNSFGGEIHLDRFSFAERSWFSTPLHSARNDDHLKENLQRSQVL